MHCKDAQTVMDAWIDGELSRETETRLNRHLEGCPACSARAQEMVCLKDLLDAHPHALPSGQLKEKTLSRFLEQASTAGVGYWWHSLGLGLQATMMASALAGLCLGYKLGANWIGAHLLSQYNISGFLFYVGDVLLSWA